MTWSRSLAVDRQPPVLTAAERAFLLEARRVVLCTIAPDGLPRPVPVCFTLAEADDGGPRLYIPLDEKPKRVADPRLLARVRDILARPDVTLLADRWDESWENLAWLRLEGRAMLLEPGPERLDGTEHALAASALHARYAQYAAHDLAGRPIIRVEITRARSWGSI